MSQPQDTYDSKDEKPGERSGSPLVGMTPYHVEHGLITPPAPQQSKEKELKRKPKDGPSKSRPTDPAAFNTRPTARVPALQQAAAAAQQGKAAALWDSSQDDIRWRDPDNRLVVCGQKPDGKPPYPPPRPAPPGAIPHGRANHPKKSTSSSPQASALSYLTDEQMSQVLEEVELEKKVESAVVRVLGRMRLSIQKP